jgi:hypothetical protein
MGMRGAGCKLEVANRAAVLAEGSSRVTERWVTDLSKDLIMNNVVSEVNYIQNIKIDEVTFGSSISEAWEVFS